MQQVLVEVKRLQPLPSTDSHSAATTDNLISPLEAHVSPSGRIHLSGGLLSSSPFGSTQPPRVRSNLDGFSSWQPLNLLKGNPSELPDTSFAGVVRSPVAIVPSSVLPASRSVLADPPHRHPPLSSHLPAKSSHPPSQAHSKLSSIRRSINTKHPSCYRCGEKGHIASSCRSSLVCFACNKVGHRSVTCKHPTKFTSISSTTPPMDSLNSRPSMKFYSNKDTRRLREILLKGVVLFDEHNRGAQFIQSHLKARFSAIPDWPWVPRKIASQYFLIDPPDDTWRDIALCECKISLGDVDFPLEPFSFARFGKGYKPQTFWLNILGFPQDLWIPSEIKRVAENLGGFWIATDPQSFDCHDMEILRIKIGVPDRSLIPTYRRLQFTDEDKTVMYHDLLIMVEEPSTQVWRKVTPPLSTSTALAVPPTLELPPPPPPPPPPVVPPPEVPFVIPPKTISPRTAIPTLLADTTNRFSVLDTEGREPVNLDVQPLVSVPVPNSGTLVFNKYLDSDPWTQDAPVPQSELTSTKLVANQTVAAPTSSSETRNSLRIKLQSVADNKGDADKPVRRSTGTGIKQLLDQFPYVHLTDSELISMYEIGGFCLGPTEDIKNKVLHKFRTISKLALSTVLDELADNHLVVQLPSSLTDISDMVLKAPNSGHTKLLNG